MCQYKSAIVLRDKTLKGGVKLLLSPWTESHSELCTIFGLKDGARLNFARVEFSPENLGTAHDVSTYKLRLDEERTPEWWNEEVHDHVAQRLKSYVERIIVNDKRDLLIGGQFVLGPKAQVNTVKEAVISAMVDGSTVDTISGGTVNDIWGGTVDTISGGTVIAIWGGTIHNVSDLYGMPNIKHAAAGCILKDDRKVK